MNWHNVLVFWGVVGGVGALLVTVTMLGAPDKTIRTVR